MSILTISELTLNKEDESDSFDGDVAVQASKPKLKRPSLYQVVLMNDDFTPMEFVVEILQVFFGMEIEQATNVMLSVHTKGKGICGVYSRDVAETKAAQVNEYSKQSEHPLLCEIEPSEDDEDSDL
ncbi:MAG: ATP-dependent Clp protease adaptor protein ClpS [Flavobacteriales bacterium]|jgi:ATP-dependent Clp protease adaptor protein ClpS